ncbi:Sulfatase [hydrothermal vent metagenome]|uniref:Sulfatase n=1 Tax=hydrothermal vent metagenome TaxID=652676 RepID=A0A3B1DM75_9ZZZZ
MTQQFIFTFLLIVLSSANLFAAEASRPNIILIIADDMAWDDCGAYGNKKIQTPHIDQLAKEGMKFNKAFLTCSSCSPTRSSIITGRYPHNTGAHQLHMPLPKEQITFVELLKKSGYYTAASGKWHLGNATKPKFDKVTNYRKICGYSGCANWVTTLKNCPKDKPFFLWLASIDPHRPYQKNIIPQPHQQSDVDVPPYLANDLETKKDLANYYDEISRMDSFIGKLMAELKARKLEENTIIVFISDNGRPFPRCKTSIYDSGVRTPFIVKWHKKVKANSVCDSLVSTIDLASTFLKLAGIQPGKTFQGKSFLPLLSHPQQTIHDYTFSEHNWHDFEDFGRSVRSKEYRYIRNYYTDIPGTPPADAVRSPSFISLRKLRDQNKLTDAQNNPFLVPRPKEELYDLKNDPFELKNLAAVPQQKERMKKLRSVLHRWEKETGDTLPAKRRPNKYDRETGETVPHYKKPSFKKN